MRRERPALVGGDILRLVTSGIYDDPLMLYREYLQNAADSVEIEAGGKGAAHVVLDRLAGRVTVRDDGAGLSPAEAVNRLTDVGNSPKVPGRHRGLRGVGRLCALAFAESVHFTTRASGREPVTRVSWSGRAFREGAGVDMDAREAIESCTEVQTLLGGDWPERFFEVRVERVTRMAAGLVLNEDAVRRYIGEVCPVPLDSSFPFATEVNAFLSQHINYFGLDVRLNERERPIKRPYGKGVRVTDELLVPFERLETRLIPRIDSDRPAAVVWLAHTPYMGSISKRLAIRGLRARVGNVQVGGDHVFEKLFHESRFNGWCVGEVHIADSRIAPNGRRDYFEVNPHLRNLENHLGTVAREIGGRCRRASSQRNRIRNVRTVIGQVKRARELAISGYLCREDAARLLQRQRARMEEIRKHVRLLPAALGVEGGEMESLESELEEVDLEALGRRANDRLTDLPPTSARALRSAFGALAATMSVDAVFEVIALVEGRLSRERAFRASRA